MKRIISVIFFTLVVLGVACGQSGKLFSVDKELSSSLINHVYQDHRNIIWIATADGLNRYDGSKFTIYKKIPGDSTSLLNNHVRVLYEDSRNRLFVGLFNGLQYYDYATDTFHDIPLLLSGGHRFPAHVMAVLERRNGDLLIATSGHGVFLIEAQGTGLAARQITELSPSYMVSLLYEDSEQNLWISTQDRGLFRLGADRKLSSYLSTSESGTITSLCEDSEGNLYAGSVANGLYAYNRASDSFQHQFAKGSDLFINKLHPVSDGKILIGTEGGGLKIFDPDVRKISEENFSIDALDFSTTKIHSIMEDKKGNIWLGVHQKGVVLLPARSNHFRYFGYKSVENNIIGSKAVTAVTKDKKGVLWVGTDGDGIYGISPDGRQQAHFSRSQNPTVPSAILSVHEDVFGTLWLGSYDRGLARLDKKTGYCAYVDGLSENENGQVARIFSIAEDKYQNLWIATMGSGLYCMNLRTGRIDHYTAPGGTEYRDDSNDLHSNWIYSVYVGKDDKLFIGTADGFGCLDVKTRSFNSTFGVNRLLSGTVVNTFNEDNEGRLWVGTSDGLMSFATGSRNFTGYSMNEGLPSNTICAIEKGRSGHLWISTSYGISRLNLKTTNFINYYANDGLQGNEFSRGAAHVDTDGVIFFGGINGITHFDPAEVTNENKTLEVFVTGFYIHNKPVTKGMKSEKFAIVNTSVMESDTFHISHKDNSFTIEFSSMEFANPERISYRYRLEPLGDWITLPPGMNNVTFSNLSPGSYTFDVRAKDYNTFSDTKGISIVVHPVWYFSTGAKLLYVLAFMSILYIFLQQGRQRLRTKRKMREHLHAKEMHEARLQLFINIAHEIRTPMSLIVSPLKKLILKDKDRERQRSYHTMNENSERIIHLINQLMDIQKIDKGQLALKFRETEMISFIREMCLAFKEEIHSRKINLRYTHDLKKLPAYIDPDNFDKVIVNILSNALKFTPDNGDIRIHLSRAENTQLNGVSRDFFQITIADSGIGIPEAELQKVFECFYQSRENRQSFKEGTGIGLHLTKSIVELHHGSIWAENNAEGPGCRFIVRLPLGKDHLNTEDLIVDSDPPAEHIPQIHHSIALPHLMHDTKTKARNKHRVLVVDDDERLGEYLCEEMGSDYHMSKCADGKEALSIILKHQPDLIISDIVMPEMDGITLCRKVKQNVNINHIPVILLTARNDEHFNIEGLGTGADAYIVKPFNIEIVKKTVQNLIRNRELLRNSYSGKQQQNDKISTIEIKSPDEKLMSRVMLTINQNITNPELSVEMLAHEIGISRVHLHRKLKQLTNQSTRDLIRNVRLNQAANLLSDGHFNISEVAFAVGFTNAAHFSNAFKELYGVSPTDYMDSKRRK